MGNALLKLLLLVSIVIFSSTMSGVNARGKKLAPLPEKVMAQLENNSQKTVQLMDQDLNLSDKKVKKIYQLKLQEAEQLARIKMNSNLSKRDVNSQSLLIKGETDRQILRKLKKNQQVLYLAHKNDYEVKDNIFEKMKGWWNSAKESLGID